MTNSAPGTAATSKQIGDWISTFSSITETPVEAGVTRLGYSVLERTAHTEFTDFMRGLGLTVWTDAAGNTIAEKPGSEPNCGFIGTGSHLDSVPLGGRFDGTAGVVIAMATAETIVRAGVQHRHTLRFVAFACEEGARFGRACIGSRIVAGLTRSEDLGSLVDADGVSASAAMRAVGIDPSRVDEARWVSGDWAAFVEVHIEQGSVLAVEDVPVGIVDVISGSTRLSITLTGTAAHTGGTPMRLRRDALCAAAEVVLFVEQLASDDQHDGTRITVGKLDVLPGSITTIPGQCTLAIDIRDVDGARQRAVSETVLARAAEIAQRRGIGYESRQLADASPEQLSPKIQAAIAASCEDEQIRYRFMASGASHDTQMVSGICPAGMIFVPSRNGGVSHAPGEFTEVEDLVRGADLLASVLLRLDAE
ncbi:MAG: Zn-dependent hydrolase [Rhodococcus sp. (in: high G+C Gram-positive bacteria)]|nr:Zn-dependent hydrolase [Rhodococcus sp. (in: high G+C Gram-positive bacteria)]